MDSNFVLSFYLYNSNNNCRNVTLQVCPSHIPDGSKQKLGPRSMPSHRQLGKKQHNTDSELRMSGEDSGIVAVALPSKKNAFQNGGGSGFVVLVTYQNVKEQCCVF